MMGSKAIVTNQVEALEPCHIYVLCSHGLNAPTCPRKRADLSLGRDSRCNTWMLAAMHYTWASIGLSHKQRALHDHDWQK
jgi:hypothetical protein